MKRITVLHLGKFYPPHMGGMEIYLRDLVRRQSAEFDVSVLVANDGRKKVVETLDGATIERVPTFGALASMPLTPSLPFALARSRPDLVHVHSPNPLAALSLVYSGYRGPLVVTHHSDILGRKQLKKITDPFLRRMLDRADRIIATSNRYLMSSTELAPYRKKCEVVPLGVDVGPSQSASSTDHGSPRPGSKTVLAVGRLVPYKGFRYLLDAMRLVDASLVIIGTGPLEQELKDRARHLGIEQKVKFCGNVVDLQKYYASSDVFVLPSISRAEAFGVVQMEAMAAGLPVVNTDLDSGVPEVSVDGVTGFTVPPRDASALAAAINRILNDADLRAKLGGAGQARVRECFSLETMVENTNRIYREVLSLRGCSQRVS